MWRKCLAILLLLCCLHQLPAISFSEGLFKDIDTQMENLTNELNFLKKDNASLLIMLQNNQIEYKELSMQAKTLEVQLESYKRTSRIWRVAFIVSIPTTALITAVVLIVTR